MSGGGGGDGHHPPQTVPGAGHHRLQAVGHRVRHLETTNHSKDYILNKFAVVIISSSLYFTEGNLEYITFMINIVLLNIFNYKDPKCTVYYIHKMIIKT